MLAVLQIFGTINSPAPLAKFGNPTTGGIGSLLNLGLKSIIIVGGLYTLFNFLMAGYAFLSAGDDSKKVAGAWAKIWQSVLGLTVMAGAFVLAAIFGWLIFGDPNFIISPTIPTP